MLRKTITAYVVILLLLCSGFSYRVYAEEANPADEPTLEELEEAAKIVTSSVDELKEVMKETLKVDDPETVAQCFKNMFTSMSSLASGIGSIGSMASSCVSFLQMLGILEDPVSASFTNIKNTLKVMDGKLDSIDAKLVDIMKAMSEIQALIEFNARTTAAENLNNHWQSLVTDYMNKGLDPLEITYESRVHDSIIDWCEHPENRNNTVLGVDNTRICLRYSLIDGKYQLMHSADNNKPTDPNDRYLMLPSDFLPEAFPYSADTYRQTITDFITQKIKEYVNFPQYPGFDCQNFDAFTKDGKGTLSDELIAEVASDTVDTLIFRTAWCNLNSADQQLGSENFVRNIKKSYEDYCTKLLTAGDGIDALINTFYLTNAFEGDVKKDLIDAINEVILDAASYGTFAIQATGPSRFLSEAEKNSVVKTYTDTIAALNKIKEKALTKNDKYCYVTNSLISVTQIDFEISGTIKEKKNGDNRAFEGASSGDFKVSVNHGSTNNLLGDVNLLVLMYALSSSRNPKKDSNAPIIDEAFISKYCNNYSDDDYDRIVTSYSAQQALSTSAKVMLKAEDEMGDYFYGDPNFTLTELPPKATTDYLSDLKAINGTTFSISSQSLINNDYLGAFGIYGESYALWAVDEAAFFGGPDESYDFLIRNYSEEFINEDFWGKHYNENYTQKTVFRAFQKEALPSLRSADDELYNPLANYRKLLETIVDDYMDAHDFDDGVISKEATCQEEGVITYSANRTDGSITSYNKTIPTKEHVWSEGVVTEKATCTDKGIITYTCNEDPMHPHVITSSIAPMGHEWEDWKIIKEASCSQLGVESRICSRCGGSESRSIGKKDDCSFIRPSYTLPLTGIE